MQIQSSSLLSSLELKLDPQCDRWLHQHHQPATCDVGLRVERRVMAGQNTAQAGQAPLGTGPSLMTTGG